MPNPIVFFDMEIGGKAAGRVEMEVGVWFVGVSKSPRVRDL